MMMNRAIFSISGAMLIGCFSTATPAIDLVAVYQQALGADASFAAAGQTLAAAKLDLPLAKSAFGPLVTANGGVAFSYNNASLEGQSSEAFSNTQTQLSLNASKKLIDPSVRLDIQSAEIGQRQAFLHYAIAQQALIERCITRYFAVLSAIDNQVLAQLEQDAIAKQLDLSTQRLEVGLGTRTDQYDAIARYEQTKAGLIAAQNSVVDAIQNLEELLGSVDTLNSEDFAVLSAEKIHYALDSAAKDAPLQWLQDSTANNKAYQLAQIQLAVAQLALEKTQKLKTLRLDATGSWGVADSSASASGLGNRNDSWTIGLNARYPLYQAGSVQAKQAQAGYQLNAAKQQLEQTRREIGSLIRTAQRALQSNNRQVEALGQAVLASESALVSKQAGFRAGITTNLDVLDGQRDLFRAKRDYLQSRYNKISAVVDLERASGNLNEADLSLVSGWLGEK